MPQVYANPEHLKQFARDLAQFNQDLFEMMTKVRASFASLGETWRDQEHEKFADEFLQTMKVLDGFIRAADEHIPFLVRKAERLEEFLTQR